LAFLDLAILAQIKKQIYEEIYFKTLDFTIILGFEYPQIYIHSTFLAMQTSTSTF
jgi:hypothetical protein